MQVLSIGELKTHFSKVIKQVKSGETIVISYGRKKENIAAIIPYKEFKTRKPRKLGLLKGRAKCVIKGNFAVSNDEFLDL